LKKRIGIIMYQTSASKGQELVAQRMVRYFRILGHEAYLIASVYHDGKETISEDSIGDEGYVLTNDRELEIPIIRVGSYTSQWPPRRVLFKDSIHTLEKIVNKFNLNVLITHSTLWNGPEEVAKFVEWRRNIKELGGFQDPLIFCHMSHFQEPSPHSYSLVERSFRMAWNRLSLRTILRVANLILVVTPYEEEEKIKMGASREKCVLFPGGVDDNAFFGSATSNPEQLSRRLGIPAEAKIVTYLGTFEERKNPKAVLDVAQRLKDRKQIHFVLAGRGDSDYARQVEQKAAQLPNVTLLNEIDEKEKWQLIKISYLNILLSRMEALGLAQLEFMFRGAPIITSGVGGQAWIVRNKREGIQVRGPDDVEGAANAVVELVDNTSEWNELSARAKDRASEFTLSKLIQKLDAAITKEIERETGMAELPPEVRSTFLEPEVVVHTWTHGTRKLVATDRRVFIQEGRLSKSTLEMPYSSITSIEHIRRYAWRTLVIGAALSTLMFIHHYISPIISRTLTSKLDHILISLIPAIGSELPHILATIWTVPIFVALLLFLIRARKGFALHGVRLDPAYLPQSFGEAIKYIREMQDRIQPKKSNNTNVNALNRAQ
jgi:glycosyltransferase involved in cell wall biosynthesis